MTDLLDRPLRPSEHAVESTVGEETVLLHLLRETYYGLDAVGTRIWRLLGQGAAPEAICAAVAAEYATDLETVRADTRVFLGDLLAHEIVVDG